MERPRPFCLSVHLSRISITLKLPLDRDKVKRPFTLVRKLVIAGTPMRRRWKWWAVQQRGLTFHLRIIMSVRSTGNSILKHSLRTLKAPPNRSLCNLSLTMLGLENGEEPSYTSCSSVNSWSLFLRGWLSPYKRKRD